MDISDLTTTEFSEFTETQSPRNYVDIQLIQNSKYFYKGNVIAA